MSHFPPNTLFLPCNFILFLLILEIYHNRHWKHHLPSINESVWVTLIFGLDLYYICLHRWQPWSLLLATFCLTMEGCICGLVQLSVEDIDGVGFTGACVTLVSCHLCLLEIELWSFIRVGQILNYWDSLIPHLRFGRTELERWLSG